MNDPHRDTSETFAPDEGERLPDDAQADLAQDAPVDDRGTDLAQDEGGTDEAEPVVVGEADTGGGVVDAHDETAETSAEPIEEAAPVVGTSADVGEPMAEPDEVMEVGVEVPASEEPAESSVAMLHDAEPDEALPPTDEAIGTGPTDLVEVAGEEGSPLPDAPAPEEAAAMEETVAEPAAAEPVDEPVTEPVKQKHAEAAEEPETIVRDPFRGPGEWYVVHTYAGYENKVKTNLESRIHTMQMEEKIFDVHIPMEDVMEIKGGKKQVVQRKVFPGYLLVKMIYDNDSWYVVRNTPGVTGFVAAGTGSKPTPLSKREVEKILAVKKEEVKPQFRLGFEEGDVVRIISGPFADFNGTISEINIDQSKLKVLVNIFDRETPVELSFDQVAKV
jgi:transcription termination/antitermination protein NusG